MDLSPLLRPRSIAVVGANDRPTSYAGLVLGNLEAAGFAGPIYGVNPKRSEALGHPCVPTLADLPEPADAVVVAIPAAGVGEVITAAGETGCGGAIVISAGFGELEAGRGLEGDLRERALAAQLPVCGPNGNGIVAMHSRAPMWGDGLGPLRAGPVAMVTQSGNVAVNALNSRRGIGWHTLVSIGNAAVTGANDWLRAIPELEGVRSVALFLEADGDGASLAEALAACNEQGVRVAVLKVGTSDAGSQAAAAHTGAIAGDQRVFRSLVEEAGAAWARDPHELLELARVLAEPRARPRGDGALAILTCSGGDSGLAADEADRRRMPLASFEPGTQERLEELLPETATVGNPLDWTALIWEEPDRLRRIVATVGGDPGVDQMVLFFDQPHDIPPKAAATWAGVRDALADGALDSAASTLLAATLPDLAPEKVAWALGERGLPFVGGLRTSLACADAVRMQAGDPERLRAIADAARRAAGRPLEGNGWMGEAQAKALLREAGIATAEGRVARDAADAVSAASELGWPVAVKLSGPHVQHKSELGAMALGLGEEAALRDAYGLLAGLPAAEGAEVLVERMGPVGVEVLVAARAHGVVPSLTMALGGIWTEVLDDAAVVPLPATAPRVEAALRSLRGALLLTGGRGGDAVDLAALADVGARLGELLLDGGFELLELNPVVATAEGALVLDAIALR